MTPFVTSVIQIDQRKLKLSRLCCEGCICNMLRRIACISEIVQRQCRLLVSIILFGFSGHGIRQERFSCCRAAHRAMVTHQKGFLNVAAPRPVHDRMEVRLDNEPDTPMHHSYRQVGLYRYMWHSQWKTRSDSEYQLGWAKTSRGFLIKGSQHQVND